MPSIFTDLALFMDTVLRLIVTQRRYISHFLQLDRITFYGLIQAVTRRGLLPESHARPALWP